MTLTSMNPPIFSDSPDSLLKIRYMSQSMARCAGYLFPRSLCKPYACSERCEACLVGTDGGQGRGKGTSVGNPSHSHAHQTTLR